MGLQRTREASHTIIFYTNALSFGAKQDLMEDNFEPNNAGKELGEEEEEDPDAALKKAAYDALTAAISKKQAHINQRNTAKRAAENKMSQIEYLEKELGKLRNSKGGYQQQIDDAQGQIDSAQEYYEQQLARVKEVVQEVSLITREDLIELRAYKNPSNVILTTLQCVLRLMNTPEKEYMRIVRIISQRDWLESLIYFNSMEITKASYNATRQQWSMAKLSYDSVYNASRACGALFHWVDAQLEHQNLVLTKDGRNKDKKRLEQVIKNANKDRLKFNKRISMAETELDSHKSQYRQLVEAYKVIQRELADLGFVDADDS